MADLGDLLGTLMVSLVRARQLADEASVAAAEYYRQHPLLEGMSVPRVRVPELTMDIPLLVKQEDPGEPAVPQQPDVIAREVAKTLTDTAAGLGLQVPGPAAAQFHEDVLTELRRQNAVGAPAVGRGGASSRAQPIGFERPLTREGVVRAVDRVLVRTLQAHRLEGIGADSARRLGEAVRQRAFDLAELKSGRPPSLAASIATAEVKDQAGAANAARIFITLREEGLEWSAAQSSDGTTRRHLTPE